MNHVAIMFFGWLGLLGSVAAWTAPSRPPPPQQPNRPLQQPYCEYNGSVGRRSILGSLVVGAVAVVAPARPRAAAAVSTFVEKQVAPPTSSISVSLSASTTMSKDDTLQPILNLQSSVQALVTSLEQEATRRGGDEAMTIDLNTISSSSGGFSVTWTERDFKALFDAHSDRVSYKQKFVDQNAFLVYYTRGFDGPGRPSIESDLPVRQTLQFGARNDAWIAYDDFVAELRYQQQQQQKDNEIVLQPLIEPLRLLLTALDDYLAACQLAK